MPNIFIRLSRYLYCLLQKHFSDKSSYAPSLTCFLLSSSHEWPFVSTGVNACIIVKQVIEHYFALHWILSRNYFYEIFPTKILYHDTWSYHNMLNLLDMDISLQKIVLYINLTISCSITLYEDIFENIPNDCLQFLSKIFHNRFGPNLCMWHSRVLPKSNVIQMVSHAIVGMHGI